MRLLEECVSVQGEIFWFIVTVHECKSSMVMGQ